MSNTPFLNLASEAHEHLIDVGVEHDGCCSACDAYQHAKENFQRAAKLLRASGEVRSWDVTIDGVKLAGGVMAGSHLEAVQMVIEGSRIKHLVNEAKALEAHDDSAQIIVQCELSEEEFTTRYYFDPPPTQKQRALKALHAEDVGAVRVVLEEAQNSAAYGGQADGTISESLWKYLKQWSDQVFTAAQLRSDLLNVKDV